MTMGCMGTIASIDMIESALFRRATSMRNLGVTNGVIPGTAVFDSMQMASLTTPLGRVAFDVNRVNANMQGLLLQVNFIFIELTSTVLMTHLFFHLTHLYINIK